MRKYQCMSGSPTFDIDKNLKLAISRVKHEYMTIRSPPALKTLVRPMFAAKTKS